MVRGGFSYHAALDALRYSAIASGGADMDRRTMSKFFADRVRGLVSLFACVVFAAALSCTGCTFLEEAASSLESPVSLEATVSESETLDSAAYASSGTTFEEVNGNAPSFNESDVAYARENEGFEYYAPLDWQGRCTGAVACLGEETMPKKGEKRGNISSIRPSGWHSVRYGFIDGESLYNRSHLIAWKLGNENANDRNLVTGTRFMNAEGMLPFEEEVIRYIERTGNHVLYRVVPVFSEDELLCRGVQMEAFSIEDGGEGVSFNVFCPNVQPGISIDYATGDNELDYR